MYPIEVFLLSCYHCTQKHITPKHLTSTNLFRTMLRSFSRPIQMHGFFSPKYGIRRLKAIVLKWLLRDCLLYIANLWNSMFQVPLLPNMTHWAVYHFFCNVSEREKCWMGYSRKNPHTPLMEGIFLDPLPFPSTWISKTAWATPPLPFRISNFKDPPPPTHLDFHKVVRYRNFNLQKSQFCMNSVFVVKKVNFIFVSS